MWIQNWGLVIAMRSSGRTHQWPNGSTVASAAGRAASTRGRQIQVSQAVIVQILGGTAGITIAGTRTAATSAVTGTTGTVGPGVESRGMLAESQALENWDLAT